MSTKARTATGSESRLGKALPQSLLITFIVHYFLRYRIMDDRPPHSRALRKGRYSSPHQIYLVTTVTQGRAPLFLEFPLGRCLVQALRHQQQCGAAETLAFVVMPDHLHWLFRLGTGHDLSSMVGFTKRMSADHINRQLGRPGRPVWQRGFHDHAVRREEEIRRLARYLVANPLRAGLVEHVGAYPLWDAVWL